MSLPVLPYDLLFHIAQYLDIDDIHSLQATCKSLRSFTLTRPVYRSLAHALLCRSRPLPLPAFRRLADVSTQNLIRAVDRAHTFEKAWRVRAPRPARSSPFLESSGHGKPQGRWYIKISAPPNEEIDWLSPITASYTLCATKSGRVVCWDVARDVCLAEWDPRSLMSQLRRMPGSPNNTNDHSGIGGNADAANERKWELWKCRVEFEERAVYFTMARVLKGSYDDNRVMEFVLMKLAFPPEVPERTSPSSSPSSNASVLIDTPHLSHPKSPVMSPTSSITSSPNNSKYHTMTTTTSPRSSPMSSSTVLPVNLPSAECEEQLTVSQSHGASSDASSRSLPRDGTYIATTAHMPEPPTHSKECSGEATIIAKPTFLPLTSFYTTGVVMNVFLLDPPRRLLSAFVWLASSNTIGLYVLLDWDKDEYIYVDTGVGCLISSNWSCILHDNQIVIHSEEADAAYQHFYPLSALRSYSRPRNGALKLSSNHSPVAANGTVGDSDSSVGEETQSQAQRQESGFIRRHHLPSISARSPPVRSVSKKFVFPRVGVTSGAGRDVQSSTSVALEALSVLDMQSVAGPSSSAGSPSGGGNVESSGNPAGEDAGAGITKISGESSSKGKGKERATEDVVVDGSPSQPLVELPRSKGKGKMREIIDHNAEEQDDVQHEEIETQNVLSSSSSSSASASAMQLLAIAVAQHSTSPVPAVQPPEPAPNPYSFPPWYPESAHFVRQWWPTLPGVPRLSCTVVLLARHYPETHHTQFVLAQHYFKVPITGSTDTDRPSSDSSTEDDEDDGDEMLHLWYVSTPFEVVCVLDSPADNEDEDAGDRPRPLVAVDFGHAVWVEYAAEPGGVYGVDASRLVGEAAPCTDSEEEDGVEGSGEEGSSDLFEGMEDGPVSQGVQTTTDRRAEGGTIFDPRRHRVPKCLRFVTFPPVYTAYDRRRGKGRTSDSGGRAREEAVVRTLEIPEELDLDGVETINIDQSQGAVILSVKEGKIFILRYE